MAVCDNMRAAFLDNGPAMLRLVLANTPLELRWVMPNDLSSYEFPPANAPLIEELLTYLGRRE